MRTLTKHDNIEGKQEWYTPKYIIDAFPVFDLDPCSPMIRPFETAKNYYTKEDNGLVQNWTGSVWLNPPYGRETKIWMRKLKEHGNGVALIFARTDTSTFFDSIWDGADGIFFFRKRLKFINENGETPGGAGAPSCLVAYGKHFCNIINSENFNIQGKFLWIR